LEPTTACCDLCSAGRRSAPDFYTADGSTSVTAHTCLAGPRWTCRTLRSFPDPVCARPLSEIARLWGVAVHGMVDATALCGAAHPPLPHDDVCRPLCRSLSLTVRFHLSWGAAADPVIWHCHGRAACSDGHQRTSVWP